MRVLAQKYSPMMTGIAGNKTLLSSCQARGQSPNKFQIQARAQRTLCYILYPKLHIKGCVCLSVSHILTIHNFSPARAVTMI